VLRSDFIQMASPPCHECGDPVERIEMRWSLNGDGDWVPGPYFMICGKEHRVPVEYLYGE
jgi:hypothetical protein